MIEIKKAEPADAKLISVLGTVTFYEAYFEQDDPHDLANYITDSFSSDATALRLDDPASTYLLAFRNGWAVGYALLLDGSREPCIGAEKTLELKRIYVVERAWRSGVGKALLRASVDEARRMGKDSIWLGVWQLNHRARPFYEKHGFRVVGTLEFPYGDAVGINDVMEKEIQ